MATGLITRTLCGKQKFDYKPDWGETFTGKRDPALVVVHLDTLEIKVLDPFEADMSPGQVSLLVYVLLPLILLVAMRLNMMVWFFPFLFFVVC